MKLRALALVGAIAACADVVTIAQDVRVVTPSPTALASIASAYTAEFVTPFVGLVGEERYSQRIPPRNSLVARTRRLVSDVLLVQLPDGNYSFFRDVTSEDGRQLRDRDERLAKLLLNPTPQAIAQAEALSRESSRRNLVDMGDRDNPLAALAMLQPRYITRFKSRSGGRDEQMGENVFIVILDESVRPTILREGDDRDAASEVRAWIDVDARRVVRTELRRAGALDGTQTDFEHNQQLGFDTPIRMRHLYGTAAYDRFRRFQVTTTERVQ